MAQRVSRNALPTRKTTPGTNQRTLRPTTQANQRREMLRLARRVAELERKRAELTRFAGFAAHELLVPLVMAEALPALLLERHATNLDQHCREDLERLAVTAAGTRAAVDALLQAARLDEGAPARPEAVDLRALVDRSVEMLEAEVRARAARIVVQPLPVVRGDPALLGVVLRNLLSNAVRYGPRRGGVIRVSASRLRGRWRISVASGGEPLAPDDLMRIFAPFERAHGERRVTGAGLGLAICRSIVERHGGSIGVHPLQAGNRFDFTVPG